MAFQFKQGDRPIPGYTIQRGIGRGGFGEVYYAMSDGGKEIALKFLRENPQVELRGVSHVLNLKSPYLVSIHDVRQSEEGDHFVLMEYVNGPSLRDLMNDQPKGLGIQKAAYLLREIAKGMAYLHDRGIVHRDLKPGNIFYEDGYVKIGDYGLAKIMSSSQHSGQTVSVGTVHYMAPEVGSGNYDRTIDIYALGVMLYEMLLGRVPFSGATMGEVLMKHLTAQPEVDELPEPFPHVIRKALAKDPKDRFQTVQEMISEIFSSEDLSRSIASFEPASISTMAERAVNQAALTMTGTPKGDGPAVMVAGGSSNVGGIYEGKLGSFGEVRVEMGVPKGRIGRIHEKISEQVGRFAGQIDQTEFAQKVASRAAANALPRVFQVLALTAVAGAVSVAFASGDGADKAGYGLQVAVHILAMVQGSLIGAWLSYDKLKLKGAFLPQLIMAGLVATAISPFEQMWHGGSRCEGWFGTMVAAMLLCDWVGRLDAGQRGRVSAGSACSAGVFGLIAGAFIAQSNSLLLAIVCATASLAVQVMAGIWPVRENVPPLPERFGEDNSSRASRTNVRVADQAMPNVGVEIGPRVAGSGSVQPMSTEPKAPSIELEPRTTIARAFWFIMTAVTACATVLLHATPAFMRELKPEQQGGFHIAGVVVSCGFLYAFTRMFRRYKVGMWRGIIRPAIFFGGLAMTAGSGTAWGVLNPRDGQELIALSGIMLGSVLALFVWFVPVAPYSPKRKDGEKPENAAEKRALKGQRLKFVANVASILTGCLIALVAVVAGHDAEEVVPAVAIMGGCLVAILHLMARRHRVPKPKIEDSTVLPIRRVFQLDPGTNLASVERLVERHLNMVGFKLAERSDLLWTFARGNWSNQFWHDDVRQWKTRISVAAYELDTGGYRMTCYLDVDSSFEKPNAEQLSGLAKELDEIQSILGGQTVTA
jgi:hypothetical protein